MGNSGSSLFFLVIIAVPVLLIMFQRRTMKRQTEATQHQLAPGAEVMTGGGLYAFVAGIDGDVIELETSPGVITRWDRRAIVKVISGGDLDDDEYDEDTDGRDADDEPDTHATDFDSPGTDTLGTDTPGTDTGGRDRT